MGKGLRFVGRVLLWFAALIVVLAAWSGVASMFGGFNVLLWATFGSVFLAWVYAIVVTIAVIYALIALIVAPFVN